MLVNHSGLDLGSINYELNGTETVLSDRRLGRACGPAGLGPGEMAKTPCTVKCTCCERRSRMRSVLPSRGVVGLEAHPKHSLLPRSRMRIANLRSA